MKVKQIEKVANEDNGTIPSGCGDTSGDGPEKAPC